MQPRLLVVSGLLSGTCRPLGEGVLSIGRDPSNTLSLKDSAVSRKHCVIQKTETGYEVLDLDSHNGTFVNEVPVRRRQIDHGHTIRVGRSEFVFLLHEGEGAEWPEKKPPELLPEAESTTLRFEAHEIVPDFGREVGRMARDLVALVKISSVVNSIRNAEALQHELLRLIFEAVPAENGAVVLLSDDDAQTTCFWNRGHGAGQKFDIRTEILHSAIWERSPVVSNSEPAGAANVVCLPLIALEKIVGVLYVTSTGADAAFREDHVHFLSAASRIAAVAIENVQALDALRSENVHLKEELRPASTLVGESPQIRRLQDFIGRVSQSDTTILLRGESGTGKEVVASAIHQNSSRRDKPFVAINCAAIPEALLESELFGHEKGAFTGAVGLKKGKFEASGDGTLFLDEIGELPPAMQAKLLRVLQQRVFERIGGTQPIPLRARVLAATNKNLEQAIKTNEFRQDLYYRLNVVSLAIPPLRERREDIPLLALFFAAKYASKNNRGFKGISKEARELILNYSWPGNVRELENAIEHALVLGLTDEILPEDLPEGVLEEQSGRTSRTLYHDALNDAKRELVRNSLREANGSVPSAARLLGVHPKYLHRLITNLGIRPAQP